MSIEVINMYALYQLRGWIQFLGSLVIGVIVAVLVLFIVHLILKK